MDGLSAYFKDGGGEDGFSVKAPFQAPEGTVTGSLSESGLYISIPIGCPHCLDVGSSDGCYACAENKDVEDIKRCAWDALMDPERIPPLPCCAMTFGGVSSLAVSCGRSGMESPCVSFGYHAEGASLTFRHDAFKFAVGHKRAARSWDDVLAFAEGHQEWAALKLSGWMDARKEELQEEAPGSAAKLAVARWQVAVAKRAFAAGDA